MFRFHFCVSAVSVVSAKSTCPWYGSVVPILDITAISMQLHVNDHGGYIYVIYVNDYGGYHFGDLCE